MSNNANAAIRNLRVMSEVLAHKCSIKDAAIVLEEQALVVSSSFAPLREPDNAVASRTGAKTPDAKAASSYIHRTSTMRAVAVLGSKHPTLGTRHGSGSRPFLHS